MLLGLLRMPTLLSPRWWRAKKAAKRIRAVMDPMVRHRYDMHQRGEDSGYSDILSAMLSATDTQSGERLNFDYDELVEQIAMLFLAGPRDFGRGLVLGALSHRRAPGYPGANVSRERRCPRRSRASICGHETAKPDAQRLSRETLRLYPSVPFFARDATRTETMRKKIIKPGSILLLCPWLSHRSETMWKSRIYSILIVSTARIRRKAFATLTFLSVSGRASASAQLSPCRRRH